jgi:hypothetical protein
MPWFGFLRWRLVSSSFVFPSCTPVLESVVDFVSGAQSPVSFPDFLFPAVQ